VAYPAGGTADSAGTLAALAAAAVGLEAARGFAAVRDREAVVALARGEAAFGFALAAVALGPVLAAASGFGVPVASGAGEVPGDAVGRELRDAVEAAPAARPGRSRLALRRAGRVRGRLVRTSRSVPLASLSLGGMARLCPNTSGPPAGAPKHRRVRTVSAPHLVATVAGTRRFRRTESMPYHEGSTFERYGGLAYVP